MAEVSTASSGDQPGARGRLHQHAARHEPGQHDEDVGLPILAPMPRARVVRSAAPTTTSSITPSSMVRASTPIVSQAAGSRHFFRLSIAAAYAEPPSARTPAPSPLAGRWSEPVDGCGRWKTVARADRDLGRRRRRLAPSCGASARPTRTPTITVVGNTADDITLHGLRICPDLDTMMYTLGGGTDADRGWGRAGESWQVMDELRAYGVEPTWFSLGDRDLGTHLVRTQLLDAGYPLSEVTAALCALAGRRSAAAAAADDRRPGRDPCRDRRSRRAGAAGERCTSRSTGCGCTPSPTRWR